MGAGGRAPLRRLAHARHLSLQWEMGLLLLCGLTLLFGLFAVLSSRLSAESARAMAAERLNVANLTVTLLDPYFQTQFENLEWTAGRLAARGPNPRLSQSELLRPAELFVTRLTLVDASGRVRWAEPSSGGAEPGTDWSGQEFVRQPLADGGRYASGILAAPGGPAQDPVVMFAVPVHTPGAPASGVLVAELHVTTALNSILASAASQLGAGGHAELVDQNMQLIGSNEPGRALGPAEHPTFYRPLLQQHASAVGLTDPIGDEDPADRGQRHVMAFVPLMSVPWGLGLGGSESVFATTADRWRGETLGLGVFGLAMALFLVWVTRRSVVKPLTALTDHSLRIAAGDFGTPVPLLGNGEVRVLAKTLEEMRGRLRQAQAAEERLSALKDEFLATASHELRSPVAALAMFSQLMLSRARRHDRIDVAAALDEIHTHANRLNGLVSRLLDTSRIDAGKLVLECEPTDVAALTRGAVKMATITALDRTLAIDAPEPVWAGVDRLRLGQVLGNLLDNAIKFSQAGGVIQVEVAADEASSSVRISVRDHGVGIPAEQRAHVFDRFFKAAGDSPHGLGLGLYISREIVELHGGHIEVESPRDGGTRMVVNLPVSVRAAEAVGRGEVHLDLNLRSTC